MYQNDNNIFYSIANMIKLVIKLYVLFILTICDELNLFNMYIV